MVEVLVPMGLTGQQVRDVCLQGMQAGPRRDRITADLPHIEAEEAALRIAFVQGRHRGLARPADDPTVRNDMRWFYENRLRDSVPGRELWQEIVGLGGRLCPLCHLGRPRTLEHSFPQATHPRLAVEPLNLVPACRDCNSERNVGHGSITISPYFDHWVKDFSWLRAEVLDFSHPEDLLFTVNRHPSFSAEQWDALQQFVSDVKLLDRYVGLAIEDYSEFVASLKIVFQLPSPADIESLLLEKVTSHLASYGINRWQTAAFEAWSRAASSIDWVSLGIAA
jgi:hypothetical protein